MTLPDTLANLETYVNSLPSLPANRTNNVRYGYTDSKEPNLVQFNGYRVTAQDWTTCGPASWASDFTIDCFAKSNADSLALTNAVNALFAGKQVTPATIFCE